MRGGIRWDRLRFHRPSPRSIPHTAITSTSWRTGTFSSPTEIPQHFRYTLEKCPELGASELTRSYDRSDYGFVVEHRWREKLTNIVTLSGFLKARDEFLDLAMPLAEKAIEQIYGGKYDVKNLVLEVRSQGRRFLEQAAIVFYDSLSRRPSGSRAILSPCRRGKTLRTRSVRRQGQPG